MSSALRPSRLRAMSPHREPLHHGIMEELGCADVYAAGGFPDAASGGADVVS